MATAPKLRLVKENSLAVSTKLAENVLPTCRDVVAHYHYIRQLLMTTDPKYLRKVPGFSDLKDLVISDVVKLWKKASLPTIELRSIHTKIIEKFTLARKRAKKIKSFLNQ